MESDKKVKVDIIGGKPKDMRVSEILVELIKRAVSFVVNGIAMWISWTCIADMFNLPKGNYLLFLGIELEIMTVVSIAGEAWKRAQ